MLPLMLLVAGLSQPPAAPAPPGPARLADASAPLPPMDFAQPDAAPPKPAPAPPAPECPKCAVAASAGTCAAAANNPFGRLPCVDPVPPCKGPDCLPLTAHKDIWKHTFHRAAQFPFPRFDQKGCPVPDEGVLIYEGMTLTVNSCTGEYELAFVATAPQIPVVLRLQLEFCRQGKELPPQVFDNPRLTLPPMRIEADPKAKPGDITGNTVRINHRGQSDLFKRKDATGLDVKNNSNDLGACPANPALCASSTVWVTIGKDWSVARSGIARFGPGTVASDEFNR